MVRIAPFATWLAPKVAPQRRDPLDLIHLERQTLSDPGLRDEVLRVYDTVQHTYLDRLRRSDTQVALKHHARLLGDAAAGVGARGLVTLVSAIERDLADGRLVDAERIEDVGFAVEEVSLFIAGLLGEAAAIN